MMIRFLDITFSLLGIIIFFPLFIVIAAMILIDDGGKIFYVQERVGKDNKNFGLIKFRTMRADSDKKGLLTVGANDSRITKPGYFLRKYKIDELPQLINVFTCQMSIAGPRPEVRKYVDMYTEEQKKILSIKPGISDFASIEYIDENILLAKSSNPEQTYIEQIMPDKIKLNKKYIDHYGVKSYFKIIFSTISKIISK